MKLTSPCTSEHDRFLESFRLAAQRGTACLLAADEDHDKAEVRRRNGRIDTVVRLVAGNAKVRLTFRIPLDALGRRGQLLFCRPEGPGVEGMWLWSPGIGARQPIDVLAACLADEPRLLADAVLAELSCHKMIRDPAWPALGKTYEWGCRIRARHDGLWCDLLIHLEAG